MSVTDPVPVSPKAQLSKLLMIVRWSPGRDQDGCQARPSLLASTATSQLGHTSFYSTHAISGSSRKNIHHRFLLRVPVHPSRKILALHTRESVSCFRPFPSAYLFDSSTTKNRNRSQRAQSVYSQRYQYLMNDNPLILTLPSPGNLSASSTLAPSAHLMPTRSGTRHHPAFLPNHRSRCCLTIQIR